MKKQIYYLVVITEWEYYRGSYLFAEKFEAEKFIRHNILTGKEWKQTIEEMELL